MDETAETLRADFSFGGQQPYYGCMANKHASMETSTVYQPSKTKGWVRDPKGMHLICMVLHRQVKA